MQKYPRTPHLAGSRLQAGDADLAQAPFAAVTAGTSWSRRSWTVPTRRSASRAAVRSAPVPRPLPDRRPAGAAVRTVQGVGDRRARRCCGRCSATATCCTASGSTPSTRCSTTRCRTTSASSTSSIGTRSSSCPPRRRRELLAGLPVRSGAGAPRRAASDTPDELTKLVGPSLCRTARWRDGAARRRRGRRGTDGRGARPTLRRDGGPVHQGRGGRADRRPVQVGAAGFLTAMLDSG